MGGHSIGGRKIGLHGGSPAALGAPGRTRPRTASGPDHRRTPAAQGSRAREPRIEARERDSAQGLGVFCTGGARPPTAMMVTFIDQHRMTYGVEPICRVLPIAPSTYFRDKAE